MCLDNYANIRDLVGVKVRDQVLFQRGNAAILDTIVYAVDYSKDQDLLRLMDFAKACLRDDVKKLSNLLSDCPTFDLELENNLLLSITIFSESMNCARVLFPRVDLSWNDNWAIKKSSEWDIPQMVNLLLQFPQVDPSAENSYALLQAKMNEQCKSCFF
jgi:hypothetical protein